MSTTKHGPRPDAQEDAWEALTLGELSREDEAVLRALAEESPELGDKLEAHRPLSATFRESTVERLADQLERERFARRRKARMAAAWGAAGMLAAAAVLFALLPGGDELPAYTLSVQGSLANVRGADEHAPDVLRVSPRSELALTFTPSAAVEGEVVLTVGLLADGKVLLAKRGAERADSGAFRLVGSVSELFDAPPGRYVLAVAVARSTLDAEELEKRVAEHDPTTRTAQLVLEPAPPP